MTKIAKIDVDELTGWDWWTLNSKGSFVLASGNSEEDKLLLLRDKLNEVIEKINKNGRNKP
jgi:hypothetical protein